MSGQNARKSLRERGGVEEGGKDRRRAHANGG